MYTMLFKYVPHSRGHPGRPQVKIYEFMFKLPTLKNLKVYVFDTNLHDLILGQFYLSYTFILFVN